MGGRKKNSKNHSIKTDGFKAWLNHHRTKYPDHPLSALRYQYLAEMMGLRVPSYVDKKTGLHRNNFRTPQILWMRSLLDQDGRELVFPDKTPKNAEKARQALVKETGLDFGEVLMAQEIEKINDHNRAVRKWEWSLMRELNRLIEESYEREKERNPPADVFKNLGSNLSGVFRYKTVNGKSIRLMLS